MKTMHLRVIATKLVVAALLFGCSAPAMVREADAEDEITLPKEPRSAKSDAGAEGGASEIPETSPDGGGTSSGPTLCDVSTAAGGNAGGPYPAATLPGCGNPAPFNPSSYETELGSYSGAGAVRAACSPADIAQLASNVKSSLTKTWNDYRFGLSPTCDACVFTKTTDTRWGAVVLVASDPKRGFVNFGACHGAVNESAECGRAFQYDQFCLAETCNGCSGATKAACVNAAWGEGGACHATHAALALKCSKLAGSTKLCGTALADHAKIICGGC